ncbi:MAG: NAD(P)-dependent oxidoreductase [Alphaproteobacteria bacterium]|nr:NAD(P)-dependent oxidoreductase [Alphaproteobacteria bacterium]
MATVAFLGLGVMGGPMAGHLAAAGHDVVVFNRTPERAARWVDTHGGRAAGTPREAAAGAEVVFSCVGADDDLREVTLGEHGAFAGMAEGTLYVDHTTTSATVARELHAVAAGRGIAFVDAPVSGGQAGAEKGVLTVMCGGDEAPCARAEPFIRAFARQVRRIGPSGAGQTCKMVNQVCSTGIIQSLAEGLHLARASGLDVPAVMDVITQGASSSWQMVNRWETMLAGEYQHGFAVDWMRKDLGIVMAQAREVGATLPVAALVDQFFADVQRMGGGRWDTSALLARLERED